MPDAYSRYSLWSSNFCISLYNIRISILILYLNNKWENRNHRKFKTTEKVWENHIRALLFCSLLEIYPTCVRINQKFRFKSHSLQTFPLVNSHGDPNVVIESFQHNLISKIEIGHQPRSEKTCWHFEAMVQQQRRKSLKKVPPCQNIPKIIKIAIGVLYIDSI